MTAFPAQRLAMTPEEYFDWEETQEVRHEYHNGEIFAMSGGTDRHALIPINLAVALAGALKGRGCRIYSADLRVQLAEGTRYTYPNLSIVCGEPAFADEKRRTLVNPTVLVEVLSPSTADYDRGPKFAFYRQIPSLQEYVIVAQDIRAVEVFRKNDEGRWTIYDPEGGVVTLASVGAELHYDAIYDGVDFTSLPPEDRRRLPG